MTSDKIPGADPFDALDQALGRDQESWRPEREGDSVTGKVLALSEVDGQYGVSPVVVLLTADDREIRVVGSRSVLKRQIYESGFQVGDYGAFRYLGQRTSQSGSTYHDYRTVRLGPDGRPPAGRLGDDHDDGIAQQPAPAPQRYDPLAPQPGDDPF